MPVRHARHLPVMSKACFQHNGRGSVISLSNLCQDLLVDRQIGCPLARAGVFLLETLDPLELVRLQTAQLRAAAIIRELPHANLAHRIDNRAALRCPNTTCHSFATISSGLCLFPILSLPQTQEPYLKSDHFSRKDHVISRSRAPVRLRRQRTKRP